MSDKDKTPSVKLPSARDISRTDFTPHGINRGRGSLKRPANKADLRKKRLVQTGAGVLVVALASGVGFGAYAMTRPEKDFSVSGKFGAAPTVKFPEVAPFAKSTVEKVISGGGAQLKKGETAYLDFATWQWTGAKKFEPQAKYKEQPATPSKVGESTGFKVLDDALTKATIGTRLLLTVKVADLGEAAQSMPLKKTDSLVFVIDVVTKQTPVTGAQAAQTDKKLPNVVAPKKEGEAPKIEIPKGADAPKELIVKTLVQGTGPVVTKGQQLVANYAGNIWRTNKEFDSSWTRGQGPATFEIGTGKVVSGWDKALVGQKAGSRVLIVIPPAEGYKDGNPDAGIKKDDVLVFVVDVLAGL